MKIEPSFFVTGPTRTGNWLVTCDHARNRVPDWVSGGDLGLPPTDMNRHIAFDIGAEGLSLALGDALDSPVICSNFSRLVIDPNRGLDDPTLVMQIYDGSLIPANRNLDPADKQRRIDELYQPYHDAYEALLAGPKDPVVLAVHSFTPQLSGRAKRPWEVGILFADDTRISAPLIAELKKEDDLTIGSNEPYVGHLPGDSIDQHALTTERRNVLIEVRNDLIETRNDQLKWAARLAPILKAALAKQEAP